MRRPGPCDRSDVSARSPQWLYPSRPVSGGCGSASPAEPEGLHGSGAGLDRRPCAGDAGLAESRRGRLRLREQHQDHGLPAGCAGRLRLPGFVPAYIRPLFCEGRGPFRWIALSGEPSDIAATDDAALELFPENRSLQRWIRLAREKVRFQGLPARICWLGFGERAAMGLRINELVNKGTLKAPVVIGRDHMDAGSVAF